MSGMSPASETESRPLPDLRGQAGWLMATGLQVQLAGSSRGEAPLPLE